MKKFSVLLSLFLVFHSQTTEKLFVIIVCSYNNEAWVVKNLDSLFEQNYENYRIIYIDDNSTDSTADIVQNYLKKYDHTKRCLFIHKNTRQYKLANLYTTIHTLCYDDEIV